MDNGPWPSPFVGSHIYLPEPGNDGGSWDKIPAEWSNIRFDAIDVLFISPFFVDPTNHSFILGNVQGGTLQGRFTWVIQAARSANPNVKIIPLQFYGDYPNLNETDFSADWSDDEINQYAGSVANFLELWHDKTLPSLSGDGQVSGRLNGWDVDDEGGTMVAQLPRIITAVRASLDALSNTLGAPKFSVSITPAWTTYLDTSVAQAVDYVNMQNYSGGKGTSPNDYKNAMPGLLDSQLVWGICSEQPGRNTLESFSDVKQKAQNIASGGPGMYTWRLNSSDAHFESIFQVWLYDIVHGASLPNPQPENVVSQDWVDNGGSR